MEAVGDLNGLRRASRGRARVLRTSVAAHMRNLWVGDHPRGSGVSLPVRQHIDNLMSIQVDHDRAERSAALKGKVVDAQTLHVLSLRGGQVHDPAHNRHPGGGDPQA
jgi:hypothetical protein